MDLLCQSCNAPIRKEDIHFERRVAKCSNCHALMRLPTPREASPAQAARADAPAQAGADVSLPPLPRAYEIVQADTRLVLVNRWLSCAIIIPLILCPLFGLILLGVA